jgi:hypothetical protein
MTSTREAIYSALFALVSGLSGFVTTSRRLRHWTDVAPEEKPALFQAQKTQGAAPVTNQPTRWHLYADLFVYVDTGQDPDAVPATLLNNLVDAIDAALSPNPVTAAPQTLGGLVTYCRISGTILTDEGTLGSQAVAIIPVEILAT